MQVRRKKLFSLFLSFALIFIFCGCQEKFKDDVIGAWAISSIEYEGSDILWDLSVNMLIFEENGKCYLPGLLREKEKKNEKGEDWRIIKRADTNYIEIIAPAHFLEGAYRSYTKEDKINKLFNLYLYNEEKDIKIISAKLLYHVK